MFMVTVNYHHLMGFDVNGRPNPGKKTHMVRNLHTCGLNHRVLKTVHIFFVCFTLKMSATTFLRNDDSIYQSIRSHTQQDLNPQQRRCNKNEVTRRFSIGCFPQRRIRPEKRTCSKRDMSDIMLKSTISDLRPPPLDAVSQLSPENIQFITHAVSFKPVSILVMNPTPLGV